MDTHTFAAQVQHPAVKQYGFTVNDSPSQLPRSLSPPPTIKEATAAEENGEVEAWSMPLHWHQPASLHIPTGMQFSLPQPSPSAFKGFKDCCEAGTLSLNGEQVVRENGRLEVVGTAHTSSGIRSLVKSVVGGLRACQQPEPSAEGLGGTYFFLDEAGRKKAIVKPCDEEPLAPNNPKGFVGRALGEPGLKPTVRVGEAAMREVAAFLLDSGRFAHVPYTVLVRVTHSVFHVAEARQQLSASDSVPESAMSCSQASTSSLFAPEAAPRPDGGRPPPSKLASLQEFVQHSGDASEMGCSRFPAKDVHRIGILDLRLFNTDRHAGNMLVRRGPRSSSTAGLADAWLGNQLELIPIDHGFCLPEALEPPYLEWLHWPQASIPFDDEELDYISSLNAAADVEFLTQELPWLPEGSLRTLQVATLLLTKCAASGLTLAEIGSVVSRPLVGLDEEPSQLETMCLAARSAVDSCSEASSASDAEDEGVYDGSPLADGLRLATVGRVGTVMGMKVPLQNAVSGDELLFQLDEEGAPRSPDRRLVTSAGSSGEHGSEASLVGSNSPDAGRYDPAPQAGLARSLATGTLHHRAARPSNRPFKRQAPTLKTPKRRGRAAYPPPVVGMHQSGMNDVFDGLDDRGWAVFMTSLEELVQAALEEGAWKAPPDRSQAMRPALGTSCPRF